MQIIHEEAGAEWCIIPHEEGMDSPEESPDAECMRQHAMPSQHFIPDGRGAVGTKPSAPGNTRAKISAQIFTFMPTEGL